MDIADTISPTFHHRHILILTSLTPEKEPVLASDSDHEYADWRDALCQAIRDVTAWKNSCRQEMNIVYPSPKRLPSVETKTLYDSIEVTLSCTAGKYDHHSSALNSYVTAQPKATQSVILRSKGT